MLARPGSYARGLHEQWTSFTLSELEAYLWSNAKHSAMYPAELRVAEVIPRNNDEIRLAMTVLDKHLALSSYFLGDNFSVTDIVASWATNWARRGGHWQNYTNVHTYIERLFARPLCTLNQAWLGLQIVSVGSASPKC